MFSYIVVTNTRLKQLKALVKIILSLVGEKIVDKFTPIFHFQKLKSVEIYTFFGKNLSRFAFLCKNFLNTDMVEGVLFCI